MIRKVEETISNKQKEFSCIDVQVLAVLGGNLKAVLMLETKSNTTAYKWLLKRGLLAENYRKNFFPLFLRRLSRSIVSTHFWTNKVITFVIVFSTSFSRFSYHLLIGTNRFNEKNLFYLSYLKKLFLKGTFLSRSQ